MTFDSRPLSRSQRNHDRQAQLPPEAHSVPDGENQVPCPVRSADDLQRRANEARIRFLTTEIEVATWLLSRVDRAHDAKERGKFLREIRETLQLASRVAMADPESHGEEVSNRLRQLKDRLDRLSAASPDASPR